jgi:hypothetical protein
MYQSEPYVEYVLHTKIVPSSSRRGEAPIGLSCNSKDLKCVVVRRRRRRPSVPIEFPRKYSFNFVWVSNNLRTTGSSLLSSHVSTYRTNCTYEKASINIEAKYGTDLRGNWYWVPRRLLGGIVNNVKLIPRGLRRIKILELYIDSVFSVGIRSVFLGIYHTDTEGKFGRYISV